MKEERKVEKKKRNRIIIWLLIIIIVFIIASLLCYKIITDKSYKVEEITEFSYFKLYENEKYGVIDKEGNILVEPKYDMITIPNPSKAVFIGQYNYNSQKGEYQTEVVNDKNETILTQYVQVLPLMFKDALSEVPYEKSVLLYKENDKYGIIDFQGKKITKAIYDSVESLLYKEGCLLVEQDGKYGIITIKGKQMIEVEYDSITADGYYDEETKYQEAGFIVGQKKEEGYRYGYINNDGKMILKVEYNEIERITEIAEDNGIYLFASKNGQAGVYQNKKQIIKHAYEEIEYNKQTQLFLVQKNEKQGVMDLQGNEILKIEYDYVMISGQNINAKKEDVEYHFDLKGNKQETESGITRLTTENSNYFITIDEQEQFGIIDKENTSILANEYSYIEYAFNNYFIVTKDGMASVIDVQSKTEVVPPYPIIQKLENKTILQAIITNPYTMVLYNEKMEKVASLEEASLKIEENYMILTSKTERKYFNNHGNEISYQEIDPNLSLYAFQQEDGKWGFKAKEGNIVIDPIYDMVTELNTYGFAGIKKDGKWGVINSKGEIIVEPIYEIEWEEPEFIGPYCKLNFGYGMIYYTKELIEK